MLLKHNIVTSIVQSIKVYKLGQAVLEYEVISCQAKQPNWLLSCHFVLAMFTKQCHQAISRDLPESHLCIIRGMKIGLRLKTTSHGLSRAAHGLGNCLPREKMLFCADSTLATHTSLTEKFFFFKGYYFKIFNATTPLYGGIFGKGITKKYQLVNSPL